MLRTGGLSAAWAWLSVITNSLVSSDAAVSHQFASSVFNLLCCLNQRSLFNLWVYWAQTLHHDLGKLSAIFQPCCTNATQSELMMRLDWCQATQVQTWSKRADTALCSLSGIYYLLNIILNIFNFIQNICTTHWLQVQQIVSADTAGCWEYCR